jgi:hypothetical protein
VFSSDSLAVDATVKGHPLSTDYLLLPRGLPRGAQHPSRQFVRTTFMPQQHATPSFLNLFPSLPGILKYDCHVLNLSRAAGESDSYPNCGTSDVAGHHHDAFYRRRRLFMRSAKLLGSEGFTSVYEALPSPNAS